MEKSKTSNRYSAEVRSRAVRRCWSMERITLHNGLRSRNVSMTLRQAPRAIAFGISGIM